MIYGASFFTVLGLGLLVYAITDGKLILRQLFHKSNNTSLNVKERRGAYLVGVASLCIALSIIVFPWVRSTTDPQDKLLGGTPAPASRSPVTPAQSSPALAPTAQLPNVAGKSLSDANSILAMAGVKDVKAVEHLNLDESQPDDTVTGQAPAAGSPVAPKVEITVGRAPVITWLTDLRPTKSGWGGQAESVEINKVPYDHSLVDEVARDGACADVKSRSSDYQIDSGRQIFRATFGLDDLSIDKSTVVRVDVLGDGRSLLDEQVRYGHHVDADIDVSNYTTLTIGYNFQSGTGEYPGCDEANIIAGRARFLSIRQ
jgi:hypothetical protein